MGVNMMGKGMSDRVDSGMEVRVRNKWRYWWLKMEVLVGKKWRYWWLKNGGIGG